MNAPKNIIIINDERAGQNTAFRDMNDFSRTMLAGGWTDNDIQEFVDDEHAGIHDAELVHELEDGGLYVYEEAHNMGWGRYETRYVYYRVWRDGSLRHVDNLDHPADAEELDEMCQ